MKLLFLLFNTLILLTLYSCEHEPSSLSTSTESIKYCNKNLEELDENPDKILIVGDSISIGYTPPLRELFPEYQVVHNLCNARNSDNGAKNIKKWVNMHDQNWEICTLNHGLHDITLKYHTTIEEYKSNLSYEISVMRKKCDKIVFMTTTQVIREDSDYGERYNKDVIERNIVAKELMNELKIPVCDLYSYSLELTDYIVDQVHLSRDGYDVLSKDVYDCMLDN